MKILILGANGFIGDAVCRRLLQDGHQITALGRRVDSARRRLPQATWVNADLADLTGPDSWQPLLATHDAVVNCAGALQDGLRDDLEKAQKDAMLALYAAASSSDIRLIVQISARTDGNARDTVFLRTKAAADVALAGSGIPHVILRPALVIGRNAYGGTALLRALASIPCLLPLVHADSPVATVALDDVAEAVVTSFDGRIAAGTDMDLASEPVQTLADVVRTHRSWLGLPPAAVIPLPSIAARPVALLADIAGRLGWRSPLRSTAMTVMTEGVLARDTPFPPIPLKSLEETLSHLAAGAQDLWFARLYLLKAPVILILSLFWLASGIIPLLEPSAAALHFAPVLAPSSALAATLLTCVLDIVLGLTVLYRPFSRAALLGMLGVSLGYLVAASVVAPVLWLEPLGPLVKVLPSLFLTLVALATLEER